MIHQTSIWIGLEDIFVEPGALWTPETSLLALILVPCLLAQCPPYSTLLGLCLPIRPFAYAKLPKKREFRRLMVCLVTKGTNVQVSFMAILRTVSSIYAKSLSLDCD